jgi:hypothetical protein
VYTFLAEQLRELQGLVAHPIVEQEGNRVAEELPQQLTRQMLEVFRQHPLYRIVIALRELAERCVESGSEGGSSRSFFLDADRLLYCGKVPKALRQARPVLLARGDQLLRSPRATPRVRSTSSVRAESLWVLGGAKEKWVMMASQQTLMCALKL